MYHYAHHERQQLVNNITNTLLCLSPYPSATTTHPTKTAMARGEEGKLKRRQARKDARDGVDDDVSDDDQQGSSLDQLKAKSSSSFIQDADEESADDSSDSDENDG
jgi:hypothetical protein